MMIPSLNCKSYSKYGQCLHKDQKKSLFIFRKECVLLRDGNEKCPLREKYPKPILPPPPGGGSGVSSKRNEVTVSNVITWADGVTGALGTEHVNKVTALEAAVAKAVMVEVVDCLVRQLRR